MTNLDAEPGSSASPGGAAEEAAAPRSRKGTERGLLAVFAAALVLVAALFPLAQMLDKRDDRQRPLYKDVLSVALMEYEHSQHGHLKARELHPGHSIAIGSHHYTLSHGVTVRVKLDGDGFCVRGRNQYGDVTKWQCGDASTPPASLGALGPPG